MSKYAHAIEVIQNWKRVEHRYSSGRWRPVEIGTSKLEDLNNPELFRLPPSQPRKVPLSIEDLRPGMALKYKTAKDWVTIYAAYPDGIQTYRGDDLRTYATLMEAWEYSLDGLTWHPCEKDEVEK